jgi:hypothetical protein
MTMHGAFWKFPRTFSAAATAGIAPRSTYVKVIGDFARWGDRVVLGCDDTAKSEFLNKHPLKGDLGGPGLRRLCLSGAFGGAPFGAVRCHDRERKSVAALRNGRSRKRQQNQP